MPTQGLSRSFVAAKFGKPEKASFSARENGQKTRKIFLTQVLMPQRLLTQSARKTKILLDLGRAI
jgi:hypothetical protein